MVSVDAVHLILAEQLSPSIRAAVTDLGGDGPGTLVHARPTADDARWPTTTPAALVHHLCGVLVSWGAACLGGEEISRDRAAEFGYTGPVEPEVDRLEGLVARLPAWAAAATRRGGLAHPAGTAFDVEGARRAGSFTPEWVLAHILHEVATHAGHLELTRDVLLSGSRDR
ncbi:DUF664 domain-containing protein [Dietzia sp. PP-33]|uniref:mycothiol transferase n=1 Tax=Dietzia sp. PP-33 TaxID=2957500 RepID=UPI0029B188F8|nr:DUF664 domain-containing protein [Dietzia sp. PP-33]MDX2355419.1 DinB family protein [Dietzia sp. PP-33]